jgi:hypothetical protein
MFSGMDYETENGNQPKITPEKAVQILNKSGLEVSAEEAEIILQFLYKLANLALDIYWKDENS